MAIEVPVSASNSLAYCPRRCRTPSWKP